MTEEELYNLVFQQDENKTVLIEGQTFGGQVNWTGTQTTRLVIPTKGLEFVNCLR